MFTQLVMESFVPASTSIKCTIILNASPYIFQTSNPCAFGTEISRNRQRNKYLLFRGMRSYFFASVAADEKKTFSFKKRNNLSIKIIYIYIK